MFKSSISLFIASLFLADKEEEVGREVIVLNGVEREVVELAVGLLEVNVSLANGFGLGCCCCDVPPPCPPPPAPNENIVDVEAVVVVGLARVVNANGFDDAAEELLVDDVAVAVSLPRPSLLRRRIKSQIINAVCY